MGAVRHSLRNGYYRLSGRVLRALPGRDRHTFLVCSCGGSGSKMLSRFLARHGRTFHPHSPNPPVNLSEPVMLPGFTEVNFVDDGKPLNARACRVVYLFRNPVEVVISRYLYQHCVNVGGNYRELPATLADYADGGRDLFGYEQHFDNWVGSAASCRSYSVCFLKYEEIWNNLPTLFEFLELPANAARRFPGRKQTAIRVPLETRAKLELMYNRLNEKISAQPGIRISEAA